MSLPDLCVQSTARRGGPGLHGVEERVQHAAREEHARHRQQRPLRAGGPGAQRAPSCETRKSLQPSARANSGSVFTCFSALCGCAAHRPGGAAPPTRPRAPGRPVAARRTTGCAASTWSSSRIAARGRTWPRAPLSRSRVRNRKPKKHKEALGKSSYGVSHRDAHASFVCCTGFPPVLCGLSGCHPLRSEGSCRKRGGGPDGPPGGPPPPSFSFPLGGGP